MPKKSTASLSAIDDKLLDGLEFCGKVYDLFDEVQSEPDGMERIRVSRKLREKRLIEELLPIARYIQDRYRDGYRLSVRWSSGSQRYDAILIASGSFVTKEVCPAELLIEVTTAVHHNDHLARKLLHERGGHHGVKSISKDPKTGQIKSTPNADDRSQNIPDLAGRIIARLKDKKKKPYPSNTVLIVNCITETVVVREEWRDAMALVADAQLHGSFHEVFLFEYRSGFSETLFADMNHQHGPVH